VSVSIRLSQVLGAAVDVEGVRVGEVTAVVGDPSFERVVGLEVVGVDFRRRFLPWVAASFADGGVRPTSALVLFEMSELDDYRRLGARIVQDQAGLDHLRVAPDGRVLHQNGQKAVFAEVASGTPTV
jgi:hypothetical protein